MITIDLENKIAAIEIGGSPTHIEIQDAITELLKHPDHSDGMDEVWDLGKASTGHLSEKEFEALADFVKERLQKLARRTALVIAEDFDYGVGRMWMAYAEMFDAIQERQLFRSVEEAVEWLISSPES